MNISKSKITSNILVSNKVTLRGEENSILHFTAGTENLAPNNNGTEYIVERGLEVNDIIVSEGAGLLKEGTEIKMKKEEQE